MIDPNISMGFLARAGGNFWRYIGKYTDSNAPRDLVNDDPSVKNAPPVKE